MNSYVAPAVLLGLCLTVGCADRGDSNARNADQPAPAAEPARDDARPEAERQPSARRQATDDAKATSGTRTTKPAASSRSAEEGTAAERRLDEQRPSAAPRASASSSNAARRVDWREVTIPQGTALPLELETALSSETAAIETPVRARLKQAVVVDGATALPAGAIVSGHVTSVERAGRVKGRSSLAFSFTQVRADNMSAGIRTAPLAFVGEASKGEDATKIGAGAVGGAIVGGIVGGGEGAAKGAAIGGAAGTGVVLATRGKEVELKSGTDLAATLAAPLTLRVPAR